MSFVKSLQNNKAFTILELAITLSIIAVGLATYVISSGIIKNYQQQSLISQIQQVKEAVVKFEKLYGALPGDVANPNLDITYNAGTPLIGNGNNVIDNNLETVLFWKHLANANLYNVNVSGDVADIYKISSNNVVGAVPAANYPDYSALRVVTNSDKGLEIEVSAYNNSSNNLAIFTPQEALEIDAKFDDGNPNSGFIRAVDAGNVAAGSCINAGAYNISNNNKACVLRFILTDNKFTYDNITPPTCNGLPIGTTRQSSSENCPYGFSGRIIEECVRTGPTSAAFVNSKRLCQPTKCSYNLTVGQTMQFPCPYGWNGNIAGTCNTNGILGYANNCTLDNDSCINLEGGRENSRTLACPLGQTGYVHQYCNGTNWVNVINNCSNLSCGSVAIGDDNNTTNIDCNNVNYTKDSTIANKIPESCAIAGNSSTIANNNNLTIGVHEVCRPSYQSGNCVVGDTRNIGCPRGHMGEHIQQCISNNGALGLYHTLTNSCRPVTCNDGSPIGTVKATSRAKCNQGEVGTVYEICTLNGSQNAAFWQLSFRNCNKQHCRNNFDSITHNSGMATYNDGAMAYEANNNYTASSCPNVNYSINNASRRCGFDGYWYSRNKACAAASNCPQLASINTGLTNMTWAQAVGGLVPPEHGEYKVITLMAPGNIGNHRCSPSYEVSDNVKLICNSRGQWVDFCNSAAYQTVINNRISLISTQEHQFNSNRLQDAGGVNINFYRDSDNNNVCNASTINFDRMHCQICHAGVCSYAD